MNSNVVLDASHPRQRGARAEHPLAVCCIRTRQQAGGADNPTKKLKFSVGIAAHPRAPLCLQNQMESKLKIKFLSKNFILIFIILFLFTGCNNINKWKVLLPPSWIDMKQIIPNVYVNSDMNITQQKILLKEIPKAKQYVKDVWGTIKSKPIIYACSTEQCSRTLGIGARAHQINNHIVLSPKALTKEMISHEWSHSELYKRADCFFNWKKIPSWFDEGVAVLVSHEPSHDKRAWKQIQTQNLSHPSTNELYKIVTTRQWTEAFHKYNKNLNKDIIVVIYATAGHEVSNWYKNAKSKGLANLIEEVKNGNSFDEIYKKHNKSLEEERGYHGDYSSF